jgi:hypothetical protein
METTCAAAVLMAIHMSAVSAGAASVDRPRADELTRQFNQKELEQLQSGAGSYSLPSSDINRPPLNQPGMMTSPTGISRAVVPPPAESPFAPR